MERSPEQPVSRIDLCAFTKQVCDHSMVSILNSKMESRLGLHLISRLKDRCGRTPHKGNQSGNVSSLAQIQELAFFAHACSGSRSFSLPLHIEVTLLESFNDLVLVGGDPVLFSVNIEVDCEIGLDHGAGEFLRGQTCKPFLHKFVDYVLVRVVC
jgi:hypothetical protein